VGGSEGCLGIGAVGWAKASAGVTGEIDGACGEGGWRESPIMPGLAQ